MVEQEETARKMSIASRTSWRCSGSGPVDEGDAGGGGGNVAEGRGETSDEEGAGGEVKYSRMRMMEAATECACVHKKINKEDK